MTDEIKDSTKLAAYALRNCAPDRWLTVLQDALEAARSEGTETARQEWRDVLTDAGVVHWTFKAEHEDNPRLALHDLLACAEAIALDPAVSMAARDLKNEGRTEGIKEAMAAIEDERKSWVEEKVRLEAALARQDNVREWPPS